MIKKYLKICLPLFALFFLLTTISCKNAHRSSTSDAPKKSRGDIERNSQGGVTPKVFNEKQIRQKIKEFENALKKRGKKLTASDWKLHDELLEIYIQMKNQPFNGTVLTIPAKSRLKTNLTSFCLNSGRAAPSRGENFQWRKQDPGIPYYRDILQLVSHKSINTNDAQSLIWNLQNKAPWESYPENYKSILQKIDPKAPLKLPSKVKDQIKNSALDYIRSSVPVLGTAEEMVGMAEGEYYKYSDYIQSINQIKSKFPLETSSDLETIPNSHLYSDVHTQGFTNQDITFYNPTNTSQQIDLADYYLQPQRSDVQRIGVAGKEPANQELFSDLEKVLFESMLKLGIGFTPLGDVADLYELLSGRDSLTNKKLDWNDRLLSGVGLIIGSGQAYRMGQRALNAPERFIVNFEQGLVEASGKELRLTKKSLTESKQVLNDAHQIENAMSASPTLRQKMRSPKYNKTDFYVAPQGEVIPAKAYRYLSSEAEGLETITKNGKLPANDKGTYFSFNDFKNSTSARNGLQVPHDAGIKVEFDTLQVIDDIKVPRGKWGTSDYLEPLTKDFPAFGVGGATQAVTSQGIKATRITNIKNGQVLYGPK